MSFTILSNKPPLGLITVTAPDGDVCFLTTAAYIGASNIVYSGDTYLARVKQNDIDVIQANGPQGYDSVPGFKLTLADADKFVWTNHCWAHGWRGAIVRLTVIRWDVVTNSYSTDAMQWTFIGGNPAHDYGSGLTTMDVQAATNFTRLKVPSVQISYLCPWTFPATFAQRTAGLNDATSIYYQCGYSADVAGGVGNLTSGVAFTSCDKTRSSTGDPSVGCMARLGHRTDTSISTDGNLLHDIAGNYTGRFGGNTWVAPDSYSGRNYVSGNKVFGFNQPNTAVIGGYWNWVYGTQWVAGHVLAPAGEPNSLRSEVVVCTALFGTAQVLKVVVNGTEIHQNASDNLMTWRYISAGGRNGAINRDNIYNTVNTQGPDPGGSLCKIEVVVLAELAAPGSVFTVQILVTGPPMITFDNTGLAIYAQPDLFDNGGNINSSISGPAANLAWASMDLIVWGNVAVSQLDPVSWYASSQICATALSYIAPNGTSQTHAQWKACFALLGSNRQTLAQVLTALRNAGNLMIAPNPKTGLIQCFVRQTKGDQQPAPVSGSNDVTARTSVHADGTSTTGYYAYLFDETNIEADSFKVTTTSIASTPNTVSIPFQDEQNGYVVDTVTEIDDVAYAYSGNQEIQVPVPFLGVPNFDQGKRCSNVQLGETLFGNPRDDPGGTLYFEFTINHRVLHLTNRLGYICGLTWQALGIGVSDPQDVRIISLQPDTNWEKFKVKCAWHRDEWYTYAYGQDPSPFHVNPLLNPPARPPYPWRPGAVVWGGFDALFPAQGGFGVKLNTANSPVTLDIVGATPMNVIGTGYKPLVPLEGATANTGGSIAPGTWVVAVGASATGPVSNLIPTVVPAGTSTNTISFSGVVWQGTAAAPCLFVGESENSLRLAKGSSWSGSSPDVNGNPTAFTVTNIDTDGAALPDINFNNFLFQAKDIIHGGVWGDKANTVGTSGGHATATFLAASWTTNQWAGYVLSAYQSSGLSGPLNWTVLSNTANTLTLGGSVLHGPAAGVVMVMRAAAAHISATTIGDDNFVNSYAPAGLTLNAEAGNLIRIIAGTGVGQSPATVKSNTAGGVFTIVKAWEITPDSTSVWIVEGPSWQYTQSTDTIHNDGTGSPFVVGSIPLLNFKSGSLLIMGLTVDSTGRTSFESYAPIRELYVPATAVPGASGEYTVPAVSLSTTLAVAITSTSATTATLTSVAGFPVGPFLFTVGSECIYAPSGASTSLTGLVRGYNGTAAATHLISAGVTVTTFTPDMAQGAMQLIALTSHSTLLAPINTSGPVTFYADLHQDATGGWATLPSTGYVSVDGTKFDQTLLNRYTVQFAIRAAGFVNVTGSSGPYPL